MKGKRVVWPQRGQVDIEEFDLPAVGKNQVLVETDVSLISPGTERAFLLGLPNAGSSYPQHPGYSNVGDVIEVGAEVDNIAVGAKVASSAGHSSHVLLSADRAFIVPEGLTNAGGGFGGKGEGDKHEMPKPPVPNPPPNLEKAVFFNLAAISLQGVRKARIELGEAVLVMGQGLIGQLALQLAKLSGAFPSIAADLIESRLKKSRECGADFALNPEDEAFQEELTRITAGAGPQVVIESTGSPEPVNTAFKLAGRGGRIVLLASTRGETEKVNFYRDVHRKGLKILGAHNAIRPSQESSPGFWTSQDDGKLTLALLANERLMVDKLITHRFEGERAPEAYKLLMDWDENLLGVILSWK